MKDTNSIAHAPPNVSSDFTVSRRQPPIATPIRGIESTPDELRHTLLRRDRLVHAIMCPFQAPVTIVCAGAGYGKTWLVLDWAAQSPKCIAWLPLSSAENSIARFIVSLRSVLHAFSSSIPDNPESSPAYGQSLDDVATLDRDLCLVLDNCHLLIDSDCLTLLDVLIENLPSNLCLMLLTRQPLPLRLARLRSMDRVRELDSRDLRFTSAEIMSALQHESIADVPPDELQRIALASEGWITGAHIRLQQVRDARKHHVTLSHRNLLDEYIQQEILSHYRPASDSLSCAPPDCHSSPLGSPRRWAPPCPPPQEWTSSALGWHSSITIPQATTASATTPCSRRAQIALRRVP